MKKKYNTLRGMLCVVLVMVVLASCSSSDNAKKYLTNQEDGLYGAIMVNDSIVFFELYYKDAPLTVSNFVGLATGVFEDNIERKGHYFDGLTFHRVVPDFVVQGGDPLGNGSGGPGYNFVDEFSSTLLHDSKGILSMANSGPNTNGSQFFITLAPTPHLDNRHSVFGKVIDETQDVLTSIIQDDVMSSITIYAKGKDAKKFLNGVTWESFKAMQDTLIATQEDSAKKIQEEIISSLESDSAYTKTEEGIYYKTLTSGKGSKVAKGDTVSVHYELRKYQDSTIIDSSYQRNQPFTLTIGSNRVIPGWEIILQKLRVGDIVDVIIPPDLAYGERGAGPIAPNTYLQFKIDVLNKE